MDSQYQAIKEVGERLRAFRIGAGLSPEDIANQTGISRAAIYRYESGQPIRVDTLAKIAHLLNVSLTSLLGVGSENISSALVFFERMRQLEAEVDHISVLFGPISYLLTSDEFDKHLPDILYESVPENVQDRKAALDDIDKIIEVLKERKLTYSQRKPNIVSLVSASELEQYVRSGFIGCVDPKNVNIEERREVARREVENIINLLIDPPIGIQIGIVVDSSPGSSFQIFTQSSRAQLAVSPFRLGAFANVRIGVANITSVHETVKLHQDVTQRLWKRSLKGEAAVKCLKQILSSQT